MAEKADCFGWLFAQARKYLLKNKDYAYVHASIRNPTTGKYFKHAYMIKAGKVYDWSTTKAMRVDEFNKAFEPKHMKVYTALDIIVNAAKYGHLGPWGK